MPKTKSEDAKIDFRGNLLFHRQFPSLNYTLGLILNSDFTPGSGLITVHLLGLYIFIIPVLSR